MSFCSRVYFVLCVNDYTVIRKAIFFVAFDVLFPVYLLRLAVQLKFLKKKVRVFFYTYKRGICACLFV